MEIFVIPKHKRGASFSVPVTDWEACTWPIQHTTYRIPPLVLWVIEGWMTKLNICSELRSHSALNSPAVFSQEDCKTVFSTFCIK